MDMLVGLIAKSKLITCFLTPQWQTTCEVDLTANASSSNFDLRLLSGHDRPSVWRGKGE